MTLHLAIGSEVIGSLPYQPDRLGDSEYLTQLQQQLFKIHAKQLETSLYRPFFFIDGIPSRMNKNLEQ